MNYLKDKQSRSDIENPLFRGPLAAWDSHSESQTQAELINQLVLKYLDAERKLAQLNQELAEKQRRLDQDQAAAAKIQRSLLPSRKMEFPGLTIAWRFLPREQLGGDIFNLIPLDGDWLASYIIDITGHGTPAALVAVLLSQMLHPESGFVTRRNGREGAEVELIPPAEVLERLEAEFPMERFNKCFSMIYFILNTVTGEMHYCNAGHPPPILIRSDGQLELLDQGGPIVGMGGIIPFNDAQIRVNPGEKIILLTDGVTEHRDLSGEQFGSERLLELVDSIKGSSLQEIVDQTYKAVMDFGGGRRPFDDISLFGLQLDG